MSVKKLVQQLKARNIGMFHTYEGANECLQYIDTWNNADCTKAAIFMMNAADNEVIRHLETAPGTGTVTVTLSREQAVALDVFANKGCDDWVYDRDHSLDLFEPEEIDDRNALMNRCDEAQQLLIAALKNTPKEEQNNE